MTIASLEIGDLVAELAKKYLGVPSTHHRRFHTGEYYHTNDAFLGNPLSHEMEDVMKKIGSPLNWKSGTYLTYYEQEHLPDVSRLDCSLLGNLTVREAFELLGIKAEVPMHVHGFYSWPLTVFVSELRRGDLLFLHNSRRRMPPDHIGIYVGNREVVHSPGVEGATVQKVGLESFTSKVEPFYGRLVAAKRLMV